MRKGTGQMKSFLLVFLLLLGGVADLYAFVDPRDSIIFESKAVVPGSDAGPTFDTSAYVYLKVWITNKDSLLAVALALQEQSIAGGAYLTLGWPRNFNGVVSRLTATLQGFRLLDVFKYHGNSPDSFHVAGVYDPLDPATIEPPNGTRKPFWEIKFDSAYSNGFVSFDTARVPQYTEFVNTVQLDVPVNFARSTVFIGTSPFLFLALVWPPHGISTVQKKQEFKWTSLLDSSLTAVPSRYKVFLSTDSIFAFADTSPTMPETTWSRADTFASGSIYFWKVLAVSNNGDSVFSERRHFHVETNHSPGAFNLLSPANENKLVFKNIDFDWADAPDFDPFDTVKYLIEISPDSSFDTGYAQTNLVTNRFTLQDSVLARGTTYFWRVKAFDTQGGAVSSNKQFRFDFLELGDTDGDEQLRPADFVLLLYILYQIIPASPPEATDMNCDRHWTGADIVLALNAIFLDEPPVCNP